MRSLRTYALLGLTLGAFAAALWLAKADAAMGLRARLPPVRDHALEVMEAQPSCKATPELEPAELLAVVRADLDDPGCPSRLLRLLVEEDHPRFGAQLERLLRARVTNDRARLRVSLALLRREGELTEPVRRELGRGSLSPRSQERLVAEMSEMFGPEVVDSALMEGGSPRYDAGHSLAAWRLAGGDLSARAAVIEALEHELIRPTLPTSPEDAGLSARRARLSQAALAGLGLDVFVLRELRARSLKGLPMPGGMPGRLAMELADEPPPCEDVTVEACGRRLIELLELPPEPFEGWVANESNEDPTPRVALPPPWDARLAALSQTPELLEEAAAWVQAAPERPAGRLLGAVANRDHAYGPTPLMAGQRGDPSDAVRYGGATPAATALAARALAASAEVELGVRAWEGQLVLESGTWRVFLGDCGPGTGPGDPQTYDAQRTRPVSDEELVALAWAEQAAGRLARGELDAAIAAWAELEATPLSAQADEEGLLGPHPLELLWPQVSGLRGAMLAAQGITQPGLDAEAAALAKAWAAERGLGSTAASLREGAAPAPSSQPTLASSCADAWRPSPLPMQPVEFPKPR